MSGDPLDCPGCGYDQMAPHNGLGDCAPAPDIAGSTGTRNQPNRTQEKQ